MSRIENLHARQILDSRGRPAVEVDVLLDDGISASASVPSGASSGNGEAYELRDGDPRWYAGLAVVTRAVAHVNSEIATAVRGCDPLDQRLLDTILIELDGTPTLSRLGANATLGVSLAACRAAAEAQARPLFDWIGELAGVAEPELPMPMVDILSGVAGRGTEAYEVLAVPVGAGSFAQALHYVSLVRSAAAEIMAERGLSTLLTDEGGPSPGFARAHEALDLMVAATQRAGLTPGTDIAIAVDVAAHSLYHPESGGYHRAREGRVADTEEMIDMIAGWVRDYPVACLKNALDEQDGAGWAELTARVGDQVQLIAEGMFTGAPAAPDGSIAEGRGNGVLVELNRNGTLSGTLEALAAARAAGFAPIVSACAGETEDAFIADLAVGTAAGQITIGSLRGSGRLSKYNRLLRIADSGVDSFAGGPPDPRMRQEGRIPECSVSGGCSQSKAAVATVARGGVHDGEDPGVV